MCSHADQMGKGIVLVFICFSLTSTQAYPHCTVTIDDYITWCEVNIQKHITQHLQTLSTPSQNLMTSVSSSRTVPPSSLSTTALSDVENLFDEEEEHHGDEDQASLQIRFISVSSVSSSAFGVYFGEESSDPDDRKSNGPQRLRERSNTLERLEEEKRVRWSDEHFGTLVSTIDTTLSLTTKTHAYIRYHFPSSLLTKPSPLKLSPSFQELLTDSSSNLNPKKIGEEKSRSVSSSNSEDSALEEFLVGMGSGYDSNEEPTLSAM